MSLPSQTTVQNLSYVYKHPTWYPTGKLDQSYHRFRKNSRAAERIRE